MSHGTLISTNELAAHLQDPDWVVIDCRFRLDDPDAGEHAYLAEHIPGARYAHLDRDLSAPVTASSGRHPLPDPEVLARRLESWGVGDGSQVVCYDEVTGPMAARLWWLLRWLGHDAAAVLDGGLNAWRADSHPVDNHRPRPARASLSVTLRPSMAVAVENITDPAGADRWLLVDARSPERFRGEHEPLDPVAGHIPGARNHPSARNLDDRGYLLAPTRLARQLRAVLGACPPQRVVSYCGSGVTACHNLLAMESAGLHGGRLFAGSWSQWVSEPARPVETGDGSRRR